MSKQAKTAGIIVYGNYIEHQNIQTQINHFDKDMLPSATPEEAALEGLAATATASDLIAGESHSDEATAPDSTTEESLAAEEPSYDPAMVASLTPIFKGNEEWARQYLEALTGKTPVEITRITNRWVREGKIDARKKHKPLWEVLREGGFYNKSLSNWNIQIQ